MIRAAAATVIALGLLTACGGPSASYDATVTKVASKNAHQMAAWVKVTNTGDTAGKPDTCAIGLYDTGGQKVGSVFGWGLRGSLKPGASSTVWMLVDVDRGSQRLVSPRASIAVC